MKMDDIMSAMHKIIYIAKSHHAVIESKIKDIGMHRSMHRMLLYLSDCETPPSQKDLAEKFEISAAAVASTLERLESDGYIEKAASDTDRRANRVTITEKGLEAIEKTRDIFMKIDGETFSGLTDEQITEMCGCLDVISQNLCKMKNDSSHGGEEI